jgi:hypothetical protein
MQICWLWSIKGKVEKIHKVTKDQFVMYFVAIECHFEVGLQTGFYFLVHNIACTTLNFEQDRNANVFFEICFPKFTL